MKNYLNNIICVFAYLIFSFNMNIAFAGAIIGETLGKLQSKTESSAKQPKKIIIQEIFYKPNSDLKEERHERIWAIFELKKGTWNSLQREHAALQKQDIEHSALIKKNLSSLLELLEWSNRTQIDRSKLHLLKTTTYPGWEGKKTVKIFFVSPIGTKSETWKKEKPTPEIFKTLIMDFKKRYSKIAYPWQDTDIKIKGAYHSSKGHWLIGLAMDFNKTKLIKGFDGIFEDDSEFNDHWYAVIDGHLKFLGANLYPLVAADFLDNGKAEWLMAYAGYNREGYILWEDDFNKKYTFLYAFH